MEKLLDNTVSVFLICLALPIAVLYAMKLVACLFILATCFIYFENPLAELTCMLSIRPTTFRTAILVGFILGIAMLIGEYNRRWKLKK